MTWVSGNVYIGPWREDKANGEGIYTYANGDEYQGTWVNSLKQGDFILTKPDGSKFKVVMNDAKQVGNMEPM